MTEISASELRHRLAEALRSAEGGDPVMITRHGKPAAALIAADQLPRLATSPANENSRRARRRASVAPPTRPRPPMRR